jgi:hypothetical protein
MTALDISRNPTGEVVISVIRAKTIQVHVQNAELGQRSKAGLWRVQTERTSEQLF